MSLLLEKLVCVLTGIWKFSLHTFAILCFSRHETPIALDIFFCIKYTYGGLPAQPVTSYDPREFSIPTLRSTLAPLLVRLPLSRR